MSLRLRALTRATHYLGVTEHPPGSNRGPQIDLWNTGAGVPRGSFWCCSFIHAMYDREGGRLPGGASVYYLLEAARKRGWVVARPFKGDLVCFEFGRDGAFDDHIGIVERVLALRWANGRFTGWIQTVEGNTAAQNDRWGSQSNGGGVFRRRRWVRGIGATFVRVPG